MGASDRNDGVLPPIPDKRYFTIGEVSELCLVKPYVLRYWEQEFVQLKPMKRRGNRRYYQHHEVLLVRRIRELLYDQGFTIHGARIQLVDVTAASIAAAAGLSVEVMDGEPDLPMDGVAEPGVSVSGAWAAQEAAAVAGPVIERARRGKVASASGAGTRALQAGAAASAEAFSAPDLSGLSRMPADDVQALREALLSIRDLLG
jgi:MerR HTH family regulatory protein